MKYQEFVHKIKHEQLIPGDRVWVFGLVFDADYQRPLLNYPLTEAEVMGNHNSYEYLSKVSEKTGRVLKSKTIRISNSWGDMGNLRREQHFEIFTNRAEAEARYQEVLREKTEQINRFIEEKTNLYNDWLAQAQEPLQNRV